MPSTHYALYLAVVYVNWDFLFISTNVCNYVVAVMSLKRLLRCHFKGSERDQNGLL